MMARVHRAGLFSAFQRAVIGAMIIAAAGVFPAALLSADKAADEAVEAAVEKAVEKAAEKVAEKAAEEATEKAELTARRPDEWRGPTKVHFLVFVLDIDDINDASQSFSANVYIQLRWKDRRLANPGGATRQVQLDEIWNPRVLLANQQGRIAKALPDIAQVNPDGTVIYRQRYTGNFSQPLDLSQFPMDKHSFTIHFVAAGYSDDLLEFSPETYRNIHGGSISDHLSLPDWEVVSHESLVLPYTPIEVIHTAGFAFRFEVERYVTYYIWQLILPLSVVVMMSWAAFWVGRENVGVRIGVATSSILTMIAHRFVLASLLPRLPYMTRMDYFTVGSTLLVFMALVTVIFTSFLTGKEYDSLAHKVDITARVTFPAFFLFLIGWFFTGDPVGGMP